MADADSPELVTLLLIDDDEQSLDMIESSLEQEGLDIRKTTRPHKGLEMFKEHRPKIVLLDMVMPEMNGMELLQEFAEIDAGSEVILMTGQYSSELAVDAVRKGAADCLSKPLDLAALRRRVRELVTQARTAAEALHLDRQLVQTFQLEGIVGRSPQMLDVFAKVRRISPHFRTALVTGPTGTGKELVAQALHKLSPGAARPFAVCNCAALVETLIESELFGHVKGAFTGATQDKVGLFEYANGGTVFLDEIGDMPLSAQAKLLRVLQNQEVQRVGSPVARKVDVRVIAATHRDLRARVKEQIFREDLFYRLAMVEISLPRLADRREDLPLLQRHFVEKLSQQYGKPIHGISRRAQSVLARYAWPGNIRELENAIGHACLMTESTVVDVKDLPPQVCTVTAPVDTESNEPLLTMEEVQERHLLRVLELVGGDKTRAAQVLGIGRATVYNLLAKIDSKGMGSVN